MKTVLVKTTSIALLGALCTVSAFAAQTKTSKVSGATNTSVAAVKPSEPSKFELPVKLSYLAYFYGPSLNNPVAASTATDSLNSNYDDTTQGDALAARHILTVAKPLGNYKLSASIDFMTVLTDPANTGTSRGFFWKDAYLKAGNSKLATIAMGPTSLKLAGDVRYYIPTSKGARINDSMGAIRASFNPSLEFAKSRFSISSVNYAKVFMQTKDKDINSGSNLTRYEFYTGPQVNFEFNDRVTAWVLYEAIVHKDTLGNWDNNPLRAKTLTDVEPGADVKITDNISVSPYLNWYPALPLKTTSVNIALSASL